MSAFLLAEQYEALAEAEQYAAWVVEAEQ